LQDLPKKQPELPPEGLKGKKARGFYFREEKKPLRAFRDFV